MKNYAMTEEEKKNFILRLKFTDTNIVACMADGSEEEHPNNREELISLLERMKQQVLDSDEYFKKINKRYNHSKEIFKFCGVVLLLIGLLYLPLNSLNSYRLVTYIEGIIISLIGFSNIPFFIKTKKNLNDVVKNRLFVQNMDSLNDIDLSKVNKKTREVMANGLDINKVDKMSRREVESLVNNGRFNRDFRSKFKRLVRTKNDDK